MLRRGSTAATHHVQPAVLEKHLVGFRHVVRRFIVASHGVWETGIGIYVQKALDATSQALHKRFHVRRTQSAVQANAHRLGMTNRSIERFTRLPRKRATRLINQSARHKHWYIQTAVLQVLSDCKQGRLCIQCVKNRLHYQNVSTTIHQTDHLLQVRVHQLIKVHIARRWVLDRWRNRTRAIRGTQCTTHKPRLAGILGRYLVAHLPCQQSALVVELVRVGFHLVVCHGNRR